MCFRDRSTTSGRSCAAAEAAPSALARAVVKALQDGVEDIYPGDVAQDLFKKWRENAKALEREMWGQ